MRSRLLVATSLAALVAPIAAAAQDVSAVLRDATRALGAEQLGAIRYTGSASTVPFG